MSKLVQATLDQMVEYSEVWLKFDFGRLKIPGEQSRAGSSPALSNSSIIEPPSPRLPRRGRGGSPQLHYGVPLAGFPSAVNPARARFFFKASPHPGFPHSGFAGTELKMKSWNNW